MTATNLQDNCNGFVTTPWPLTSPHLKHDTSDAPDIDLLVIALRGCVDDLWCHPKDGTLHGCRCPDAIDIIGALGNAKVCYLTDARCFDQDVICFQVLIQIKSMKVGMEKE